MKVKNLILGIGIVVVFALTLWQGIEAFDPSPQWDDFCNNVEPAPRAIPSERELQINQEECESSGGKWVSNYCDYYTECQQQFNAAQKSYSQKVFIISLIVAIIALALGFTFLQTEPVGSALIGSAVWAIFYGSAINWRNFSNILRFLLLLIALVLLIVLALKINRKKENVFVSLIKKGISRD